MGKNYVGLLQQIWMETTFCHQDRKQISSLQASKQALPPHCLFCARCSASDA